MAEIKIEKKKKPIWPWVIFLLIVAAIFWWLLAQDDPDTENFEQETEVVDPVSDDDRPTAKSNESDTETNQQTAVAEYQSYLKENEGNMGLEHKYTHTGITLMAAAIDAINQDLQNQVNADVKKLKQMADRIKVHTYAQTHADTIKAAFMMTSNILDKMMTSNKMQAGSEIKELENLAQQVSKEELATNQEKVVNRFFNKSAAIIEKIHQATTRA